LSTRAIAALANCLPAGALSVREADRRAVAVDLWPRHLIRLSHGEPWSLPLAVVWPESLDDLVALVRTAADVGVTLVPYGAGSGVVGGSTPEAHQVVLDLKRMNRLLSVDVQARWAHAQAGILGELLERQLNRQGCTQGHFPSSILCSSLGGWIAARSAGQMSSRYGKIEDQVVGGTVVLGDGRVLRQMPVPVNSALLSSLIGAEGTLAIWADAFVRVHPLPNTRAWRGFMFPDLTRALGAAQAWLGAGLSPQVVRVYDPLDTFLHRQSHAPHVARDRGPSRLAWLGANFPRLTSMLGDILAGGCLCIVGLAGEPEQVTSELAVVLDLAERFAGMDMGSTPGEAWFQRRYAVSFTQSRTYRAGVAADTMEVGCAWGRVEPVYQAVRAQALQVGAQVLAHFSHVYGEGASIYFTFGIPLKGGAELYDTLWERCLAAAVTAGANVSHHHGTGRLKRLALARVLGGSRRLWLEMGAHLDPARVLNPALLQEIDGAPKPAAAPPQEVGTGLAACPPEMEVSALEAQLRTHGRTLGPVAQLFGARSIVEVARARELWQFNAQLRVIEPMLIGVDGEVAGEPVHFAPAPRAAMGPDLLQAMLDATPQRLWLRPQAFPVRSLQITGTFGDLMALARELVRDETTGRLPLTLHWGEGAARLSLMFVADSFQASLWNRIQQAASRFTCEELPAPTLLPLPAGERLWLAGTHTALSTFLDDATAESLAGTLPWLDPLGAVGFVLLPESLSAPQKTAWRARAQRLHLTAAIEPVELAPRGHTQATPRKDESHAETLVPLRTLSVHKAALDNCTYCPKLCRYACPVADAAGNEAFTPRQLMLTAALATRASPPLTSLGLMPLWACVDCRGCKRACDHGNDVASVLMVARAELVAQQLAPAPVQAFLAEFRHRDAPPDVDEAIALRLALRMGTNNSPTALFLGCQNTNADCTVAKAALQLALEQLGPTRMLTGSVPCCGLPLWRWGDRAGFVRHARRFAEALTGIQRLVVDDPGCAYALRVLYPQVGVDTPPIITTTELLREARWQVTDALAWSPADDPFATRYLGEPGLRALLAEHGVSLPQASVLEGDSGTPGGMLLSHYDVDLEKRVARAWRDDLLGGDGRRILVASPSLRRTLHAHGFGGDDLLEVWWRHRK